MTATRDLLAEKGYHATTIAEIARRAGIGTAPIYRRWSSRESLIEHAVFDEVEPFSMPRATDDLLADLRVWVRTFLARLAEPATRAAVSGLMLTFQQRPASYEMLHQWADAPARAAFGERVAGELSGEAPGFAADLIFDQLVAATLAQALTRGDADAELFEARTAAVLLALVRSSGALEL